MKRYDMEIEEYVASPESVVTRIGCFPVECPDGDWVKWEDVEQEMMPIPIIEIVEIEGYDPREMFLVKVNGEYDGSYANIENARLYVERIKRMLNIKDNDNDNH